jgi:NitT/TauT family transport system ATP-binding protein
LTSAAAERDELRVPHVGDPAASSSAAGSLPAVSFEGVVFAYPDGTRAVDDLTFTIRSGSTVGIVGPSGCGKSTLLGLVAGLLRPSAGAITSRTPDPGRHPLSMVFQRETLLPWLTAAENVRMYAQFRGHRIPRSRLMRALDRRRSKTSDELDERVETLLTSVGLGDSGDKYPYQLSGGMRRRLAFLAAVAPNPQVLLLDEPFSSVDEPTRVAIHQDVFRITRSMQMTTILVTHDLAEALSLCDRVIILTSRPARIAQDHAVDFGDDRVMLKLRETPDFLRLYARLWHDLSEQIEHANEAAKDGVKP